MASETKLRPVTEIRLSREMIAAGAALTRDEDESAFRFLGSQVKAVMRACRTCRGERVTIYAGGMQDDGYCELRRCSECSDGKRIGRSDIPAVTEATEGSKDG